MIYEFESRIRYSETGEDGRLSLPGLVNCFQDCSTFQSEAIGMGIDYLKKNHRAWILSAWQIVIRQMPRLGEQVRTATWAYEFKRFYGLRNFTLQDTQGRMYAWANSTWVLFDTLLQRPVRVPQEEGLAYDPQERLAMDYAPRKIALPAAGGPEELSEEDGLEPIIVGRHHLDTNHHVNNGQYIAMASEYLPEAFQIRQVRAEYRAQARLGDEIIPRRFRSRDRSLILLENREGAPYTVVEFCGGREKCLD